MDSWIHTFTGRKFDPLHPDPGQVVIEDIAHALALKCRFTGHTRTFYSVAEHSVRVAALLGFWGHNPQTQLQGLLHDASEAYLPDISATIKHLVSISGTAFAVQEDWIVAEVLTGLGLDDIGHPKTSHEVKAADVVLCVTEARDLLHGVSEWSWKTPDPLPEPITAWAWQEAETGFVRAYYRLRGEMGMGVGEKEG